MKKWIRWQGLIAFVAIVGAGVAFWLLLADQLVKRAIEAAGTGAVGARVELQSADLTLSPLGLTLKGLAVTDPAEPMTNMLEATRLALTMDTGRLLLGKVDIGEIAADDIRLGTPRKTSGAIEKKAAEKSLELEGDAAGDGGGMSMPDVADIIAREGLDTLRLVEKIEADISEKEAAWDARIKELPAQPEMDAFEQRGKDIEILFRGSRMDKLKAVKQADDLRKDIRAAIRKIKTAASDLEDDYKQLKADAQAALKAPGADLKRLKAKYPLSPKGLENMGVVLFGPKVAGYIRKARVLYKKAAPLLKSDGKAEGPKPGPIKGVDVVFREFNPAPALRVRSILAKVTTASGQVGGTIEEISSDQSISGKPTVFTFEGQGLKDGASIISNGRFDHVRPESSEDRIYFNMSNIPVSGLQLSGSSDLPVTVKSGVSSVEVSATVKSGGALEARAEYAIASATIEAAPPEGTGKIMAVVGRILSSLEGISVSAKATGTLQDFDLSLSTDVDEALKGAASGLVKEEAKKFEAKLKEAIKEKTSVPLSGISAKLKGMGDRKSALSGNSNKLETTLEGLLEINAGNLLGF